MKKIDHTPILKKQLPCPQQMPLIGDLAPSFVAETTKGTIYFPKDYQGKWVILFSHPADFTPVCTTEFILFSQMSEEFKLYNTELLGLSIDSLSSHIAWLYTIQDQVKFHGLKNIHIDFPLIADLNTKIAQKYGMLHPNDNTTKTVRSVFFIDPKAIIRTILYYPSSMGRNFDEIKRILISLQTSDAFNVSTPANWQPGDDVISSVPKTLDEAKIAAKDNKEKTNAWFLCLDSLPCEKIMSKIHKKELHSLSKKQKKKN